MRHATHDEILEALSFALRYRGRTRTHDADGFMAQTAAERLLEHLQRSGFVLMRKPPAPEHTAPTAPPAAHPNLPSGSKQGSGPGVGPGQLSE